MVSVPAVECIAEFLSEVDQELQRPASEILNKYSVRNRNVREKVGIGLVLKC